MEQEAEAEVEFDMESDGEMDMDDEELGSREDHVPSPGSSEDESDASFKVAKSGVSAQTGKYRRKRRVLHQGTGSGARCFEDLTDDDIAFMDFKELTRLMNAAGLSRQAIAETKARRRRLKNRQSARLCSNKKRELCNELSTDNVRLQDELKALQQAYAKLQREHHALRNQYDMLAGCNTGSSSKRSRDH